jgi:hypothetical protein
LVYFRLLCTFNSAGKVQDDRIRGVAFGDGGQFDRLFVVGNHHLSKHDVVQVVGGVAARGTGLTVDRATRKVWACTPV